MNQKQRFRWQHQLFIGGVALLIVSTAQGASKSPIRLTIGDKATGHTLRYLGITNVTDVASRKTQEKYIKDSGCNTTKYWEIWDRVKFNLGHRTYLYGSDLKTTRAIAIRQARDEIDDIDWGLELFGSDKQMHKMAADYVFLKGLDVEPLIDLVAKYRVVDLRDKQTLWRWMFLYSIWTNKVKKFDFHLWELGNECDRRYSLMNAELGSDALREAEKITGVKVKVGAAGHHDWRKVKLTEVIDQLLAGDAGKRLDALSFHSFAYNRGMKFPELKGYRTYAQWQAELDAIQKKYRKDNPLPWWDTEFGWWPHSKEVTTPWGNSRAVKGVLSIESANLLSAIEYASRIMWESQCGVEYSCVWRMFTKEGKFAKTKHPPTFGGVIKIKDDGSVRVTKPYYAIRMVARALVSNKEALPVKGAPKGLGFVALASRDKKRTYLTLVNRHSTAARDLEIILPTALKGRPYSIREVSEKRNDEQVAKGTIQTRLRIQAAALAVTQLIVE